MTLDERSEQGTLPAHFGSEEAALEKARRRALGAYYTPDRLSCIVAQWAIDRPDGDVLEPGFGGCGFLVAAKLRLQELGQKEPHTRLHGCDIDARAFVHLQKILETGAPQEKFPNVDFLQTVPNATWPNRKFRTALGNPPYVSYQALGDRRAEYQAILERDGWSLSARASLWAYFVLHALSFLEEGGRVAWVLPGSLLRANYAEYVRDAIAARFTKAAIIHVHERLFALEGAEEETVILVADGYQSNGKMTKAVQDFYVEDVEDLGPLLQQWDQGRLPMASTARSSAIQALQEFADLESVALGDLLSAKIGLVTGDNKYFLFSEKRAKEAGLDLRTLKPVLAKGSMAPGLKLLKRDLDRAIAADRACLLLSVPRIPPSNTSIARYLEAYPKERIASVSTFKKRASWHDPADNNIPDAFWPVMRDLGPKLILNPQQVHCTNTLHRIFFDPGVTAHQKMAIAICIQSAYGQLSAELEGRSYGSGVLKHEPRDVERIRIPWPSEADYAETRRVFQKVDLALRSGLHGDAMRIADSYVASHAGRAYSRERRNALVAALRAIRAARLPKKNERKVATQTKL